jgi:predicted nuclease of predicted toxin-antitoxin system
MMLRHKVIVYVSGIYDARDTGINIVSNRKESIIITENHILMLP